MINGEKNNKHRAMLECAKILGCDPNQVQRKMMTMYENLKACAAILEKYGVK